MDRRESKDLPETSSVSSSAHTPKLSLELKASVSSHQEIPFSPKTPGQEKFFPEVCNLYLGSLEYTQHFLRQYIDPPPGFGNKEKPDSAYDSQIYTPEDSSAMDNRTNLDSLDDLASEADFCTRESIAGGTDIADPRDLLQEYRKYRNFCKRLQTKLVDIQQVTGLYYDANTQLILDQINADVECVPCSECERLRKVNEMLSEQVGSHRDLTPDSRSKHGDPLYCSRKDFNEVTAQVAKLREENKSLVEQLEMENGRNQVMERLAEERSDNSAKLKKELDAAIQHIEDLQDYIRKADLANASEIATLRGKHKAKKAALQNELARIHETYQRSLKSLESRSSALTQRLKELQPDSDLGEESVCGKCSQLQSVNSRLEDRVQGLEEYIRAGNERNMRDAMLAEQRFRDLEGKLAVAMAECEGKSRESAGLHISARITQEVFEAYEMIMKWWKRDSCDRQEWLREGSKLLQSLGKSLLNAESSQSSTFPCTGREVRQKVHQQIIKIEEMLNETPASPEVERIREEYLQLPYLLKPLFDMLKTYEKGVNSDALTACVAKLRAEKGELELSLDRKERELKDLRPLKLTTAQIEAEVKQLQKSLQFHEKKTSSLRRDNDSLKGKVSDLRSVLGEMVTATQKSKVETSASMDELLRYKEKLQTYKKKVEESKEREGQLQKELQQLREFADYQSHQAMILNEKAEELRQQNEELRLENDELKNTYEYKFN